MIRSAQFKNDDQYCFIYNTPSQFDDLLIRSDGKILTEVKFINSSSPLNCNVCDDFSVSVMRELAQWLDTYFSGKVPPPFTDYVISSDSIFVKRVYKLVQNISYGSYMTYGELSHLYCVTYGVKYMSAQAIGFALNRNPFHIIIPCHRVLGAKGKLTGYAGGLSNKAALLELETVPFFSPI